MANGSVIISMGREDEGGVKVCREYRPSHREEMASLEQHVKDCTEFLGDGYTQVNRWIDEYFASLGPKHRRIRHHKEGIEEARLLFGEKGALAAIVHILRDCRHIPERGDYESGIVDALGLKKTWPTSAYSAYSEEDFRAVVTNQLFGPNGI